MMLRECIRVQELAEIILKSTEFYKFFDYVQKSTFDIASDAFATFKVRMEYFIFIRKHVDDSEPRLSFSQNSIDFVSTISYKPTNDMYGIEKHMNPCPSSCSLLHKQSERCIYETTREMPLRTTIFQMEGK